MGSRSESLRRQLCSSIASRSAD
ncbi:AntiZyme INhibitor [Caenorhabditis elegans]|uniref:AntiZyme INhibitor n=1 Tax=Caenorhabditis elegans TaxID=6239 RepID=A0A2K5ATM2_CAEEL|nr:Uncharacterized protein CELE_F53F10.2 [Caenorhabditis elegans]SPC47130.2 Uncharacterized protein CELE_F53F10.2 [Caenorhabditis elegans]|eukprot:NP_001348678.2 Uncharacterized protein CELE_F53F10.2 [Caenorhabditis elegans]